MSTPFNSAAPSGPTPASPMKQSGSFSNWLKGTSDWIEELSPAGQPYSTGWIAGPSNMASVLALTSDWECTAFAASRVGFDIDMQLALTYVGPPVAVPANGNIGNVTVGTVDQGFRPRWMGTLSSGFTGMLASASVHNGGEMQLAAIAPGYTSMDAGTTFTLQGHWRMATIDNI